MYEEIPRVVALNPNRAGESRHLSTVPGLPDLVQPNQQHNDDLFLTHDQLNEASNVTDTVTQPVPLFRKYLKVAEVLPEESIAETPEPIKHPTYYFHFNDARMRGSGVIKATESTRLRAAMQAVANIVPTYEDTTVGDIDISVKKLKVFLGTKQSIDGQETRREKAVSLDIVLAELIEELTATNEPSLQAIKQLEREYSSIGVYALKQLKVDFLSGLHRQRIETIYRQKLTALKEPTKDDDSIT